MSEKKRESWIDICKGIAIIFVVMGHVVSSFHNSGLLKEATAFNYVGKLIYSFHMPLFFMISGLLFTKSKQSPLGQCLKKKIAAYGIPYTVFSLIIGGSKIIFSSFVNGNVRLTDLLSILFYPMSFFWFLYALLVISAIQLVLGHIGGKHQAEFAFFFGLFVRIALSFVPDTIYGFNIKELGLIDAAKYYIWFVIGQYFLCYLIEKLKGFGGKNSYIIIPFFVAVYCLIVYMLMHFSLSGVYFDVPLAFIGSMIICLLSISIKENKVLQHIGKFTMPIYLFHGLVISVLRIGLIKLHIPFWGGLVPMIVCTGLGLMIPMVIYHILKHFIVFDFCIYPTKYLVFKHNKQDK